MLLKQLILLFGLLISTTSLLAGEARIAVASNFTAVAKELAGDFSQRSGHRLKISFGSSGKIYTQIYNGAPFEVFLSADAERPERLEREGLVLAGSRFTYARGRLALWSPSSTDAEQIQQRIEQGDYRRLALANPKLAPYGAAARSYLNSLMLENVERYSVYGENIAQTYQFVATGNADLGLVALSQLQSQPVHSYWVVPEQSYQPIRQQAVLLKRGQHSDVAKAFIVYLRQSDAQAIIGRHGYGIEPLTLARRSNESLL